MIEAVDLKDLLMAELERENVKLKRALSQQFARVPVLESLVQDLQALSSRFVSVADVEPTNNVAERAILPAVTTLRL